MKVRMRVDVSGTREGREWPRRGSIIDLPDAEARDYCAAGMAEPVATFPAVETAVQPASELRSDTETGAALRRSPGRKALQTEKG